MSLTIGSLFSGIGGLELGLERAGLGPVLWQVELSKHLHTSLAEHWPDAERHRDIRSADGARLPAVDIICGGFPCQDLSCAGKRAGLGGARSGLWFEMLRVVSEHRPRWVVVENAGKGASWIDVAVSGLELAGYACLPFAFTAADLGAPFERQRHWVLARATDQRERGRTGADADLQTLASAAHACSIANDATWEGNGSSLPKFHCGGLRQQSRRGAGQDGAGAHLAAPADSEGTVALPDQDGQLEPCWCQRDERGRACGRDCARRADHWAVEPDVARMVSRVSPRLVSRRRRAREHALGNCVVPQCAEALGWMIRELDRE